MRTVEITFTRGEAYTVMDILGDYIKEHQETANDQDKSVAMRDAAHEAAVEVSRIRNRMCEVMR